MAKKRKRETKSEGIKKSKYDVEPDPTSEDFIFDEVDRFHQERDNLLLQNGAALKKSAIRNTEEVLGVASDSDDDNEKIEEYQKRLRQYTGRSYDIFDSSDESGDEKEKAADDSDSEMLESDLDDDQLEEKEVAKLQKNLAGYLDDDDFGLSNLKSTLETRKLDFQQTQKNLSDLSEKEKQKVLENESPELLPLVEELKSTLKCVINECSDPTVLDSKFRKTALKLMLDYCLNLNFYLVLKFKRENAASHPVMSRILEYKQGLKSLMLSKFSGSKPNEADDSLEDGDKESISGNEELGEDGDRRAITKTIAKNRGLTPSRNKANKNPRVRNRNKYRKAKIRRKGQIREPRKEIRKYDGEISGIKAGIKKGIKFK